MTAMPFIDAHTHLHMRAADSAHFLACTGRKAQLQGTPDEVLPIMDRHGGAVALIAPWLFARQEFEERLASNGRRANRDALLTDIGARWHALNSWAVEAGSVHRGRFVSLVGVDPDLFGEQETRATIRHHLDRGALGLKVIPVSIGLYPSDERMGVVWEEANRHGVAVLTPSSVLPQHFRARFGLPDAKADLIHPRSYEPVLRSFPSCRVVLAHLGRGLNEQMVALCTRYENVFGDTTGILEKLGRPGEPTADELVRFFRRIGTDRILFGTNYPMVNPADTLQAFLALPLTEHERHQILFDNFARVYGRRT